MKLCLTNLKYYWSVKTITIKNAETCSNVFNVVEDECGDLVFKFKCGCNSVFDSKGTLVEFHMGWLLTCRGRLVIFLSEVD